MKLTNKQETEISIYSPLTEGLSLQIQRVLKGDLTSADVTFLGTGYKPDPYVQVGLPAENGEITLEVVSNTFLETKLTDWQIKELLAFGWNAPDAHNPNFWMRTDPNDTHDSSQVLVYSAKLVFGLTPDTWFTFGTSPLDEAMNNSGLFWRMRGKAGVVCLPGQNKSSALEGSR